MLKLVENPVVQAIPVVQVNPVVQAFVCFISYY